MILPQILNRQRVAAVNYVTQLMLALTVIINKLFIICAVLTC